MGLVIPNPVAGSTASTRAFWGFEGMDRMARPKLLWNHENNPGAQMGTEEEV